MRHFTFFSLFLLTFSGPAKAQTPQAFHYQAVVRDNDGKPLTNQSAAILVELLQNNTPVYAEIHGITTDEFGLVNLAIGRGQAQTGKFDTIQWKHATYLRIGINTAGTGGNFETLGTSELLGVPYALYAAGDADSDPVNELELPAGAQKGDLLYHDGTGWKRLPAGTPGAVLTMGADGLPVWFKAPSPLDELLKVPLPGGQLMYVHPTDNVFPIEWGVTGTDIAALPNITELNDANLDFKGEENTAAIVAQLGANNGAAYAAKYCDDLVAFGFDDWYLPAKGELNEMYKKLGPAITGGSGHITTGYYWSSSECDAVFAWNQFFEFAPQTFINKKFGGDRARCVRR